MVREPILLRSVLHDREIEVALTMARIEGLGMRRSTLLELSGMELYEVAHVHRCFAGELAHGVRHAVVERCSS